MTFLINLLVWIPMMVVPAVISYFIVPSTGMASLMLSRALIMLGPMFVIYMITYYLNVPYLLFKGKKLWFAVASVVLILGVNIHLIFADMSTMPSIVQMGFYAWLATSISTNILVILAAIGIRSFVRSHKTQIALQEKLRKTAEAELVWLKNQLNPHFLFNSLNNISSLTQIDPDQAQDAIGQLSDLLRYALYESNKPEVPLSGEVEFMRNYISLCDCDARTPRQSKKTSASRTIRIKLCHCSLSHSSRMPSSMARATTSHLTSASLSAKSQREWCSIAATPTCRKMCTIKADRV